MPDTDTTTGGMPGTGGTPGQVGQSQPPSAGGTPAAGTTSTTTQGTGGMPGTGGTPGQPEDVTGLKSALSKEREAAAAEKAAREAAEAELKQLREATQSDAEKALTQAKREAAAEERTKWQAHIRSSEIRSSLRAAGMTNDKTLALAIQAPELVKLKVTDEGAVEGLTEAITAFKRDYPELFAAAAPAPTGGQPPAPAAGTTPPAPAGGSWDGSAGGRGGAQPASLQDAVSQQLAKNHR